MELDFVIYIKTNEFLHEKKLIKLWSTTGNGRYYVVKTDQLHVKECGHWCYILLTNVRDKNSLLVLRYYTRRYFRCKLIFGMFTVWTKNGDFKTAWNRNNMMIPSNVFLQVNILILWFILLLVFLSCHLYKMIFW